MFGKLMLDLNIMLNKIKIKGNLYMFSYRKCPCIDMMPSLPFILDISSNRMLLRHNRNKPNEIFHILKIFHRRFFFCFNTIHISSFHV